MVILVGACRVMLCQTGVMFCHKVATTALILELQGTRVTSGCAGCRAGGSNGGWR